METQFLVSASSAMAVLSPVVLDGTTGLVVSEKVTPSPLPKTSPAPSYSKLIAEAASLWRSGAENRKSLGAILIQIHSMTARRGNGSFQKACAAIGIKKTSAYEYMHEANWAGVLPKKKRVVRKDVRSSSFKRSGKFAELRIEVDERQGKLWSKMDRDNPLALARILNEVVRTFSILQNEAAIMTALGASIRELSRINA